MDALQQSLRKKIFVAEDDPEVRETLSIMLEDAGYQVRATACGTPILEGSFSRVDLFILDKLMPDIDGLEICRHLRAQSATKDIPVIMISAKAKSGNEALHAGANDYIEKPFEMHYLLNVVSKYTRCRSY
jgi:CheY-like chemotaxis protein